VVVPFRSFRRPMTGERHARPLSSQRVATSLVLSRSSRFGNETDPGTFGSAR
jgi:hypothetical protein